MRSFKFIRVLFQKLLYLRFLLFQRHRHNRLVIEQVAGKSFVVLPGVFNPKLFFSSEFFVQTFSETFIPPGAVVLDMGTGSGVGAVFAAQYAARGIAVDVNPDAVRCARINALMNGVDDRLEVRQGDLFAPVEGERFDVVLFNPPYITGNPKNNLEKAFFSIGLAERFAVGLCTHLKPSGYALMILSNITDEDGFLRPLKNGFTMKRIAQKHLLSETLSIYKISPER